MTRRIVVTGAAGFLGSHLCEALLRRGDSVVGVDNLLTGRLENLAHVRTLGSFTFVQQDVTRGLAVGPSVHAVLHFASPASPLDYARWPLETLRAGALGTEAALQLAQVRHATFLAASTSEVYGSPAVHPQPESYWGSVNPIGPRSCYDEAKRYAEALTMAYHRVHGVDTRIVRIFNTYGPRMRAHDGRAVPTFISQALAGQPLTVFGTGQQTRSLCYVSDLVAGILRLLDAAEGEAIHEPVNLGTPQEVTLRELAELIVRLTGSRSAITYTARPPDDPEMRCPDISRAQALLGWQPVVGLEEGLRRTIAAAQAGAGPAALGRPWGG